MSPGFKLRITWEPIRVSDPIDARIPQKNHGISRLSPVSPCFTQLNIARDPNNSQWSILTYLSESKHRPNWHILWMSLSHSLSYPLHDDRRAFMQCTALPLNQQKKLNTLLIMRDGKVLSNSAQTSLFLCISSTMSVIKHRHPFTFLYRSLLFFLFHFQWLGTCASTTIKTTLIIPMRIPE